ncbi:MAG TPA: PQQ-binding-like beta-propeller repeat protein [Bryobacteraceae bacterium]|nr:PQQ-binding-like beta-propeller repeat protein [Bryobacteraceae bacterium]
MRSFSLLALLVAIASVASPAAPDGAAVFESHCATCHQTVTGTRVPTRAELGNLTPEQVMTALLRGKMTLQGASLSTNEVRAVALYASGKNFSVTPVDPAAGRCPGNPKFSPGSGDWNGWGVNVSNARFQPNPGLKAEDVPRLKLKWAFGFPDDTQAAAQPTIVGGRIFVGSNAGTVYSLDASTGCVYWSYDAGGIVRTAVSIVKSPKTSKWVAYFGDYHASMHAVDAETGREIWSTKVDDHPAARIVGSPTYYKGRLYVPVASAEELFGMSPQYECCTFRGNLNALDAETGKPVWKSYSVPDPPKVYKTNAAGTKLYGPAGAGIWNSPTIDEKRHRVYVGTGNSYTGVAIPTSDSILAFDLDTGSLLWSQQATPGDNWMTGCPKNPNCPDNPGDDVDFGSASVLRSLPGGKQVLVATQKSGVVYGFDPDNRGKILWQTRVGAGGAQGGILWGGALDDHTIYTAVSDQNRGPKAMPGMYAVKVDTGEKLWSTPAPEGAGIKSQLSAVSAMPGIAFSGSWGGHMRAYSTKTGEIVWDFDAMRSFDTINHVPAQGGSFDGGGPAIADGMMVTTCGYGFVGGKAGNVLLVFSVDGK